MLSVPETLKSPMQEISESGCSLFAISANTARLELGGLTNFSVVQVIFLYLSEGGGNISFIFMGSITFAIFG